MLLNTSAFKQPILLVRHGQAAHHLSGEPGGSTDHPLVENGKKQLTCLADALTPCLKNIPVTLLSSNLSRAADSARILGAALGCAVTTDPRLREFDSGDATGLSAEERKKTEVKPSGPLWDWRPYPHAETWREFCLRVSACMGSAWPAPDNGLLLVVGHFGTLYNIVVWWLGLKEAWFNDLNLSFHTDPASLSLLDINRWNEHALVFLNRTDHLNGGNH